MKIKNIDYYGDCEFCGEETMLDFIIETSCMDIEICSKCMSELTDILL